MPANRADAGADSGFVITICIGADAGTDANVGQSDVSAIRLQRHVESQHEDVTVCQPSVPNSRVLRSQPGLRGEQLLDRLVEFEV